MRTLKNKLLIGLCLVSLITAVTACGSSSSHTKSAEAPNQPNTIIIKNFMFTPASLTVKVGTTVTVVNDDSAAHTLTADDKSFDTGTLNQNDSKTITLNKVGSFTYKCSFHNYMTGVIQVTQ